MDSPVNLPGPLDERIDQTARNLVEYRPGQRGIVETVIEREFDPAGGLAAFPQRDEIPLTVEPGKRSLDQRHADLTARHVVVAGHEHLADAAERNPDFSRHASVRRLDHAGMIAPRKELGIECNIGDQGEHLFGAVPDQDGLVYCFHRMQGSRNCRHALRAALTSPTFVPICTPWPKNPTPQRKNPPGSLITKKPPTTTSSRSASRRGWCWKAGKSNRCAKARCS